MEVEYVAVSEVTKEVVWLWKFLTELGAITKPSNPMIMYCDDSGAIAQAKE